jgi:hypothetical protein
MSNRLEHTSVGTNSAMAGTRTGLGTLVEPHLRADSRSHLHRASRSDRSIEYRLLYALGFSIFFVIAILRRVLPIERLFGRVRQPARGVVREAREVTSATIPYAFMG